MAGRMGNGSARYAAIAVALLAILQCAMAATYTVGGTPGWNLKVVNYTNWAAQNTFKVGDTLVFKYTSGLHTVLQVSEANYKACNLTAPLQSYQSGSDTVALTDATTHYFICGIPTHCSLGMAVAIAVSGGTTPSGAPSPAPTLSPAPKVSPTPSPPSPAPAHAPASSSHSPSLSTSPSPASPSPSETSSSSSPSPSSSFAMPPPVSSTPSSPTPPSQAQAPSTNAASTVHSETVVLLSALLLGGFSLFF
ncbi:hypothetical protein O6H91_23G040700 [Diphasiastrum complanatum]|uniref:Uncharacterized protein n=3 Tax=Diphasiastrum complanatum TaxID=34168 RepID=A0ACC2A9W4_DIPCM|nr:hypothetical protein O6H91_23G040700 [Diphasiastrum complanatum]KAJ7514360.1 hypothetical protein O6H91_23G040700 [Diphasiastrum complanatum]KAJ7514361.1 hypothetical protein O6H91_23G040700 [Diphasiastrum complanatum]